MDDENVDKFHAVADRVVSEERPALPAATCITPLTSEQLIISDELAGILVHVEEALAKMVIDLNANRSGTDNHLSALLERLVLKSFDKMLRTPATLKMITDVMLDNPGFISPLAALVKSESNRLTTRQANIDAQYRQFMQLGTKGD